MKGQLGLEYLMVYAFSIAAVGYVLFATNILGLLGLGGASGGMSTPVTGSCYITPQLNCAGMDINSKTGNVVVTFSNGAGTSLLFPENSFVVKPAGSSATYVGTCLSQVQQQSQGQGSQSSSTGSNGNDNGYGNDCNNNGKGKGDAPSNHCGSSTQQLSQPNTIYSNYSASGTKVVCTAEVSSTLFKPGAQADPAFTIGYRVCQNSKACLQELNTTGTAITYAS